VGVARDGAERSPRWVCCRSACKGDRSCPLPGRSSPTEQAATSRQSRESVVARRRESPLSTVPACVSLPPKALLSEVACTASSVEVVLDDANDLRWGDAQDVARDDISRAYRIIDDQHRQLVTPRT